jgi:hypothetical protein
MFVRVSQSASECCPERGGMPSRLAINLNEVFSAIWCKQIHESGPIHEIWKNNSMFWFKSDGLDSSSGVDPPDVRIQWFKIHPESRNGARKKSSAVEIFAKHCSGAQQRRCGFDSNLLHGMVLAVKFVYACWIGPQTRNRARKGSVVAEIFEKHSGLTGLVHGEERQLTLKIAVPDSHRGILSTPACIYVCWVGPETWTGARMRSAAAKKTVKHCAHSRFLSCCRTNTFFLSFLGNRWPHSGPVSIFLTDSTLDITCKGQKQSAARISDGNFRGSQHVAGHLNFDYLGNSQSFSRSVSWFWADSTTVNFD